VIWETPVKWGILADAVVVCGSCRPSPARHISPKISHRQLHIRFLAGRPFPSYNQPNAPFNQGLFVDLLHVVIFEIFKIVQFSTF
jgi:hypothetical protein